MNNLPYICEMNNIKTIKQRTYYYCAAACLKMCLNVDLEQYEIFDILNKNTLDKNNWYSDPDSIYNFLLEYGDFLRTSDISSSSIDATEWILSCMIKTKTSAPMLVCGGKHWVVYSGYQMDHLGTPKGLYICDPWPTTSSIIILPF